MLSIVYSSRASADFNVAGLRGLLTQSRRNNELDDLTGMLLYRSGYFLQVLEGPEAAVRQRMSVIEDDSRHSEIRMLIEEAVDARAFPDWTMAFEQLQLDPADQVPGLRVAFDDLSNDRSSSSTLPAVRALIAWYHQRA